MNLKSKKILVPTLSTALVVALIYLLNSGEKRNRGIEGTVIPTKEALSKIDSISFYIENSGSMFGYVNRDNEFKESVIGLSYSPDFDNSIKNFYYINGTESPSKNSKVHITPIGENATILKNKLNESSMRVGDVRYSDLTKMFEVALEKAKNNNISILVSDCIYDVGEEQDPLAALRIETQETQRIFRSRLAKENISTVIIKAYSKFNGHYYYASKKGSQILSNEIRPYYIVFFGKTELLNKYVTEQKLDSRITGEFEFARFITVKENNIPYQSVSANRIGDFRFDKNNKNKLINAKPDRNGLGFQFAIAVDYSSLPFPESYLTDVNNYTCNLGYVVKKVEPIQPSQRHGISFNNPTHIITVFAESNPLGNLEITLKNNVPSWISNTDVNNESSIDNTSTYGFKPLTDAILMAYEHKNQGQNVAKFKIEITK